MLTEFREQFPEFSASSDAQVERVLAEATEIHNQSKRATLFLAAHLLKLDQQTSDGVESSPEKESASAGALSVSYKTQAETGREAFFTSTSYGKRFLTLEKRNARSGIGVLVV